jgi:hypothetical protein
LEDCEPGTDVAVETIGNWYWIADEALRPVNSEGDTDCR